MRKQGREHDSVHPVDEVPPAGRLAVLGIQHLLVMYAGTVAVPYVIGRALDMSPADIAQMVSANTIFAGLGTAAGVKAQDRPKLRWPWRPREAGRHSA